MLNPADRLLLLECLRPPAGCQIDRAVGTSFSLDLLALLTAPLAFTFFDWEEEDGTVTADPLALLEAIRRHAGKITLFCQAGEIKLPPAAQRLTAYLEGSVVEVGVPAPRTGVFHPKVWLLRYRSNIDGEPVRMRLVVLSRNLTLDQSWDIVVVLDGHVVDRKLAIAANHPVGEFIEALPELAIRPMQPMAREKIHALAQEVRRVQWDLPEGVEECGFWPLGFGGRYQWPFGNGNDRRPILVMSPFLADSLLVRLTERASSATLISRPDSLAGLAPETLSRYSTKYAFDVDSAAETDVDRSIGDPKLSGLHAKVFVIDDGWKARMLLGSANATNAAFRDNIEFLIELVGSKKNLGIASLLEKPVSGQTALIDLLQPWTTGNQIVDPEAAAREALQKKLDGLKRRVAAIPLTVIVTATEDNTYRLMIQSEVPVPELNAARLYCWPATLRSDRGVQVLGGSKLAVPFAHLSLEALTGFVAFEIEVTENGFTVGGQFAASATIQGMPGERLERLLASMIKNPEELLRLLWLLLEAQGGFAGLADSMNVVPSATPWTASRDGEYPLFERVLRALATAPETLRDIGRLIDDLSRTLEGSALLPPGLTRLWAAVRSAVPKLAS